MPAALAEGAILRKGSALEAAGNFSVKAARRRKPARKKYKIFDIVDPFVRKNKTRKPVFSTL